MTSPRRRSSERLAAALVAALLGASAASPASAIDAGTNRTPGAAATTDTLEAALLQAFERSEAGAIDPLREALRAMPDPAIRAVIRMRLAASRLDLPGVRSEMRGLTRLGVQPNWRAIARATEAGAAFACGDYALASLDAGAWLDLPDGTDPIHTRSDMEQMRAIAAQLARTPRQATASNRAGSTRTWRDKASLLRATVTVGRVSQEAVLDTGANLSVVTETTAKRLGLTVMEKADVRSSTRAAVPVRIAIAPRLEIAGTSLTNVAFLVLKDADLSIPLPGGYEIPAIIGFPVFRALKQVTFTTGSLLLGGDRTDLAIPSNLVASGSDLFALASVNGIAVPLHLDSGASHTTLAPRFVAEHPGFVAGLERRTVRTGGAGGITEGSAHVLRDAGVAVGGVTTSLPAVDVADGAPSVTGHYGTLGQDVLRAAAGYTIDFERMTLTLTSADSAPARSAGDAATP